MKTKSDDELQAMLAHPEVWRPLAMLAAAHTELERRGIHYDITTSAPQERRTVARGWGESLKHIALLLWSVALEVLLVAPTILFFLIACTPALTDVEGPPLGTVDRLRFIGAAALIPAYAYFVHTRVRRDCARWIG